MPDQQCECQAGFFAARKRAARRGRHVAAEVEAAEKVAVILLARGFVEAHEMLQRRLLGAQRFYLVLGEIADFQPLALASRT